MHIAYLCDEYPPGPHGGIGSQTQTLARAMAARGHQVTVAGVYRVPSLVEDHDHGVRVIRVPHSAVPRTGFLVNGWRLREVLRRCHDEHAFDVIEGPENAFAMLPRRFPCATIIKMNGGHHFFAVTLGRRPRPWRAWLERRSFARADYLAAVSRYVAEVTGRLIASAARPVETLPNPIDTRLFRPGLAGRVPGRIVFVGTLTEKKGVRQLVQALAAIRRRVPEAHLQLIGRDTRDPATGRGYAETLRALVTAGDAGAVEFLGHADRDALPAMIGAASVAVFPSHMESQGIVIAEAMAVGTPVVTSRTGPGPEVVGDTAAGLLCDPHDPASIADQVIAVLTDPGLTDRLGRAGRERAVQAYSADVLVGRVEAFYERCRRDWAARAAAGRLAPTESRS